MLSKFEQRAMWQGYRKRLSQIGNPLLIVKSAVGVSATQRSMLRKKLMAKAAAEAFVKEDARQNLLEAEWAAATEHML